MDRINPDTDRPLLITVPVRRTGSSDGSGAERRTDRSHSADTGGRTGAGEEEATRFVLKRTRKPRTKVDTVNAADLGSALAGLCGIVAGFRGDHWLIDEATLTDSVAAPLSRIINRNTKLAKAVSAYADPIALLVGLSTVLAAPLYYEYTLTKNGNPITAAVPNLRVSENGGRNEDTQQNTAGSALANTVANTF